MYHHHLLIIKGASMRSLERGFKPDMRLVDAVALALEVVHTRSPLQSNSSSDAESSEGRGRVAEVSNPGEDEDEHLSDVFIITRSGPTSNATTDRNNVATSRSEGTGHWRSNHRSLQIRKFFRIRRLSQSLIDEISREDVGDQKTKIM
jgi:hypothetical protein